MAYAWFRRNFGADPNRSTSYTFIGSEPPYCPGTDQICAIYAELDEMGEAIIDANLETLMNFSISTGLNQIRVLLRHNY